ncbi:MAG: BPSS1780 family membrane protein [Burkholderiales bacterium]
MRLQTVPARQGATWVREGMRTFFMRPFAFSAMTGVVIFGLLLVKLLPVLAIVVLPLTPLVTLGFMIAARSVRDGGSPTLRVFVDPLRAPRPRVVALLQLGLVYAVATFAIMWFGDLFGGDGSEVLREAVPAAAGAASAPPTIAISSDAAFSMLLQFALAGLLSVPFWHAPALVYWDGHGCAKALFSSTLACWRNRGAFFVYGAVWFGCVMALSLVVGLFVALLGQPQWLMVASAPLSLVMASLFYPSLYFTFADCFVASDPAGSSPTPTEERS